LDLAGKTIYVQKNSSFIERLNNLEDEIGDTIYIIEDSHRVVEQLIRQVATGEINYTISDENVALVNQKYYSGIDIATPISFPQHLAWAVGKESDSLLNEVNLWIEEFKRSAESKYIYNKYFKNPRSVKITQSEYHSVSGGKISMYDDVIKEQSVTLNWDWRLLASLVYQESGFNPDVRSWVGAFGLMQLMPGTAEKYGVDTLSSPDENIIAGVKFLKWLDNQFKELVEDDQERIKFVMASYNVGIAHVFDAMRLAEKYDKDPAKWNDNVDYYLRNKSDPKYYNDSVVYYGYARGEEPYKFVNEIIERYDHYRNVIN
ncbi:MAG: transglycosylase SLT domain-containing protein, partial [Bacteroidales bacterium]|nr:transglycosylase SLT domain-containing protein [Bacteroidales bacterium]